MFVRRDAGMGDRGTQEEMRRDHDVNLHSFLLDGGSGAVVVARVQCSFGQTCQIDDVLRS